MISSLPCVVKVRRPFTLMLGESIRKYRNRAIEAAAVIEELIALAKQMGEAGKKGEELKLY